MDYLCNMHIFRVKICLVFFVSALMTFAQKGGLHNLGSGADLCIYDSVPMSVRLVEKGFSNQTEVIFCPAGIRRSSQSDARRRYAFNWESKYNTIYFRNRDGIVYEGMNEHGFSASLVYLQDCELPEREKQLIPIAASLAVNFFIDHFTCIDTALLAIWDIRIYDDLGMEGGWPFRIVLHDTSGASAYVEYIEGSRQVYTPESPAFVVAGPDRGSLIKLAYIPDEKPQSDIEKLYIEMLPSVNLPNAPLILLQLHMKYFSDTQFNTFFRYPHEREITILISGDEEAVFSFSEAEFIPGKEVTTVFF